MKRSVSSGGGADLLKLSASGLRLALLVRTEKLVRSSNGVVFLWGFSLVSVSFFVGFGSSRAFVPFRSVVGLSLACGCCSWALRGSFSSFSGSVLWACFGSRRLAVAFGVRVSRLVGFAVRVSRGWCSSVGSCWVVSVPVVR